MILREQLKIPGPPKGPFWVLIGHFSSRLRPESPLMSRNPSTSWGAPAVIDRKWQFIEDSGAYRFTDKLLTTSEALNFNHINRLTGGGGGNRTRVRESSAQSVYMLVPSFVSYPEGHSREGFHPDQPANYFALSPTGSETRLSCNLRPFHSHRKETERRQPLRG